MGTIGFRKACDEDETSVPSHIGDVGQLTTNDDSDDEETWQFRTRNIVLAIQVGPLSLVFGKHE